MSISEVKVRATIEFGGESISTPYVLSFSVTRNRNSPGTMNASVKVPAQRSGTASGEVIVKAGTSSGKDTIFTGDLKSVTVSPCWDDPYYVILNIQAVDFLDRLRDTSFTRRQLGHDQSFAFITGVQGQQSSTKFDAVNAPTKTFMDAKDTSGTGLGAYGNSPSMSEQKKGNDNITQGRLGDIQLDITLITGTT